MKHLTSMFLVIGYILIFFGCQNDNLTEPDLTQSDQVLASTAKMKTKFTGICTPTNPPNPGDNAWYDAADDWRVTGISIWITEEVTQINEVTFELKGTAELTVEGNRGKWEISWHGCQTLTSSGFKIVAHTVGTGIEGEVNGLRAKWKYTMDYDGTPETFKYDFKGKITESN